MKILYSIAATIGMAAVLSVAPALAHTEEPAESTTTLEERIQAYKDKHNAELDPKEERSFPAKCRSSQVSFNNIQQEITTLQANRMRVYGNIQSHIDKLIRQLEAGDNDTTVLKANLEELHVRVDGFNSTFNELKQVIEDMIAMDCEADPAGYKSALEETRELYGTLKAQSVEIKQFINDAAKKTIKDIRQLLAHPRLPEEAN